jgi:hypothetical protein
MKIGQLVQKLKGKKYTHTHTQCVLIRLLFLEKGMSSEKKGQNYMLFTYANEQV